MSKRIIKIFAIILSFCLLFEQAGFAQVAGQLDLSARFASFAQALRPSDSFRPLHLRYLSYNNQDNSFKLLLDKGNFPAGPSLRSATFASLSAGSGAEAISSETKSLLKYFLIGVSLPNEAFWVNLRPDSPDSIIDQDLAKTDIGKIFLETDLKLKKDTALATSPSTPQGKKYWDSLYKKADELLGGENVTIPTLTRPWIVPDEIIIRVSPQGAYVYKATLKVMLEADYLKGQRPIMQGAVPNNTYEFKDTRLKALNDYSTKLIKELIIPNLNKKINTSKEYASLRQVYYSLILAQWFKQNYYGKGGTYSYLINKKQLNGLTSNQPANIQDYFNQYQSSFKNGEYNQQEQIKTLQGAAVRSYFSGGITMGNEIAPAITAGAVSVGQGREGQFPKLTVNLEVEATGGNLDDPAGVEVSLSEAAALAIGDAPQGTTLMLPSTVKLVKHLLPWLQGWVAAIRPVEIIQSAIGLGSFVGMHDNGSQKAIDQRNRGHRAIKAVELAAVMTAVPLLGYFTTLAFVPALGIGLGVALLANILAHGAYNTLAQKRGWAKLELPEGGSPVDKEMIESWAEDAASGNPEGFSKLRELILQGGSPDLVILAISNLGRAARNSQSDETVEFLKKVFSLWGDREIKKAVILALPGNKGAHEFLRSITLSSADTEVQWTATVVLTIELMMNFAVDQPIDPRAISYLLPSSEEAELSPEAGLARERIWLTVDILGRLGALAHRTIPRLLSLLENASPEEEAVVRRALTNIGPGQASEWLELGMLLYHRSYYVRLAALEQIDLMGEAAGSLASRLLWRLSFFSSQSEEEQQFHQRLREIIEGINEFPASIVPAVESDLRSGAVGSILSLAATEVLGRTNSPEALKALIVFRQEIRGRVGPAARRARTAANQAIRKLEEKFGSAASISWLPAAELPRSKPPETSYAMRPGESREAHQQRIIQDHGIFIETNGRSGQEFSRLAQAGFGIDAVGMEEGFFWRQTEGGAFVLHVPADALTDEVKMSAAIQRVLEIQQAFGSQDAPSDEFGYFNPAAGEIVLDLERARAVFGEELYQAFRGVALQMLEQRFSSEGLQSMPVEEQEKQIATLFTGFVHAHEIFHQLVDIIQKSIPGFELTPEQEERLANIFAKNAFAMELNAEEQKASTAFREEIKFMVSENAEAVEGVTRQLDIKYEAPAFLLNLNQLGVDIYGIRAATAQDRDENGKLIVPDGAKAMRIEGRVWQGVKNAALVSLALIAPSSAIQAENGQAAAAGAPAVASAQAEETVELEGKAMGSVDRINGDYQPTGTNTLLRPTANLKQGQTGGFGLSLPAEAIIYQIGTFVSLVNDAEVEGLVKEYAGALDLRDQALAAFKAVLKDRHVFTAVKSFLADGGAIFVYSGRGGKYDHKQLTIELGENNDQGQARSYLEMQKLILHELLHYIFDKMDCFLWEESATGGLDHILISFLEERFNLIQSLRSGLRPRLGKKTLSFLEQGDGPGLKGYLFSDEYYRGSVHSSLWYPLLIKESNSVYRSFSIKLSNGNILEISRQYNRPPYTAFGIFASVDATGNKFIRYQLRRLEDFDWDELFASGFVPSEDMDLILAELKRYTDDPLLGQEYVFTDEEIQDFAFLGAYHANIYRYSLLLALSIKGQLEQALGREVPLEEVLTSQEFQQRYSSFLGNLVLNAVNSQGRDISKQSKAAFETGFTGQPGQVSTGNFDHFAAIADAVIAAFSSGQLALPVSVSAQGVVNFTQGPVTINGATINIVIDNTLDSPVTVSQDGATITINQDRINQILQGKNLTPEELLAATQRILIHEITEAMHPNQNQNIRNALAPIPLERDQRQARELADSRGFQGGAASTALDLMPVGDLVQMLINNTEDSSAARVALEKKLLNRETYDEAYYALLGKAVKITPHLLVMLDSQFRTVRLAAMVFLKNALMTHQSLIDRGFPEGAGLSEDFSRELTMRTILCLRKTDALGATDELFLESATDTLAWMWISAQDRLFAALSSPDYRVRESAFRLLGMVPTAWEKKDKELPAQSSAWARIWMEKIVKYFSQPVSQAEWQSVEEGINSTDRSVQAAAFGRWFAYGQRHMYVTGTPVPLSGPAVLRTVARQVANELGLNGDDFVLVFFGGGLTPTELDILVVAREGTEEGAESFMAALEERLESFGFEIDTEVFSGHLVVTPAQLAGLLSAQDEEKLLPIRQSALLKFKPVFGDAEFLHRELLSQGQSMNVLADKDLYKTIAEGDQGALSSKPELRVIQRISWFGLLLLRGRGIAVEDPTDILNIFELMRAQGILNPKQRDDLEKFYHQAMR